MSLHIYVNTLHTCMHMYMQIPGTLVLTPSFIGCFEISGLFTGAHNLVHSPVIAATPAILESGVRTWPLDESFEAFPAISGLLEPMGLHVVLCMCVYRLFVCVCVFSWVFSFECVSKTSHGFEMPCAQRYGRFGLLARKISTRPLKGSTPANNWKQPTT